MVVKIGKSKFYDLRPKWHNFLKTARVNSLETEKID